MLFGLFFVAPIIAMGQDSLIVDKKRIDKIIKEEIGKIESKYQNGYKEGRVTWTYPKKIAKDELIAIDIKLDGDTFLLYYFDPVTYKFRDGIDLR